MKPLATLSALAIAVAVTATPLPKRWVYLSTNMLVDANVEKDIQLLNRAHIAGYTGVLISDSKFMLWDRMGQHYIDNCQKVRATARKLNMEFVAAVAPIGYSNDLLSRDPNLAEGLPVVDAPFVATNDGHLIPQPESRLANGNFEQSKNNTPTGWGFVDQPGKITTIVKEDGRTALKMTDIGKFDPENGHARAAQTLHLHRFRYFHVSVWVKTQDFDSAGNCQILALGKESRNLQQSSLPIQNTMPWTKIDVTFNTLDNTDVIFYIGCWGGKGGTIWWSGAKIEPAGLVNLIRRKGAPFTVKSRGSAIFLSSQERALPRPELAEGAWHGVRSADAFLALGTSRDPELAEGSLRRGEGSSLRQSARIFPLLPGEGLAATGACEGSLAWGAVPRPRGEVSILPQSARIFPLLAGEGLAATGACEGSLAWGAVPRPRGEDSNLQPTTFEEHKDFDNAVDPRMGNHSWPGDFDVWHQGPTLSIPSGSRIKPGDVVYISYCHTSLIYGGQAMCCMGDPETMEIVRWQIAQVHKYLQPDGYMLSQDEIRMTGWDESCLATDKTPAELLADNVHQSIQAVREEDPGKTVYAWSDMFDPNHNAKKTGPYYLVKGDGPWYGSWKGLDKDVVILNWNSDPNSRKATLDFFAKLGCRQILAGYYDAPPDHIKPWLADAANTPGLVGVMYTTWVGNFGDLEKFIAALPTR